MNKKKEIYIQILCSEIENLKDKQEYKKYQRNYKIGKKFWALPSTFMQDVYSTLVVFLRIVSLGIEQCLFWSGLCCIPVSAKSGD